MIKRTVQKDRTSVRVQFILAETRVTSDEVSLVGEFNEWRRGKTPLRRRDDGTRSASVTLSTGQKFAFSYLGDDDRWYDEETADSAAPNRHGGWHSVIRT